jgi:hypothetical protein
MPVNVRVRSFPATIRETSSRPNRHFYFPAIRCRSDLPKIAGLESGGILGVALFFFWTAMALAPIFPLLPWFWPLLHCAEPTLP